MPHQVGLLVIATNRYIDFVPPLCESVSQYFLKKHAVQMFVFTDGNVPQGVHKIPYEHRPWPYSTLLRYHAFTQHHKSLCQMDYLYYSDADMRFVADVGEEVLGDLVATEHPGFYRKPRNAFTYERRRESTAFIGPEEGLQYFAGGFNGGRAPQYLAMARDISRMIDQDLSHGIIAIWHDESYLNRYLVDHLPAKVLSPSYCYPEHADWAPPLSPKLLALAKDHEAMRGGPPTYVAVGRRLKKALRKSFRTLGFPGWRKQPR